MVTATTPTERELSSFDGTKLFVRTLEASSTHPKAKANVLLLHGYLDHSGRYLEVLQKLSEAGYRATIYDFRGHGKSSGQRGYCWSFQDYFRDLETVADSLANASDIPLFVFGHSNGGLTILDYLLTEDTNKLKNLQGVIICSPFLGPAAELPQSKIIASKVLGQCLPRLALPQVDVTETDLTRDTDRQLEHKQDPLVLHYFTVGWALNAMGAQGRVVTQLRTCPVPFLFFYATADTVASPIINEKMAEQLTHEDKTVVPCQDARHECWNEIDREEFFAMMVAWLNQRAK